MAQVIDRTVGANPTGFDMRTELNNIIGALESDNSGSSEPLNPVPYMKWLDTSNATYYYYKERNHDNTAWVTLFRYTVATKIMEAVSNGVVLSQTGIANEIHASSSKTTPVDADEIGLIDSDSTFTLKKLTWANLKATLKNYFDTLYVSLIGNQTIEGIKTFTSSPIVPTPTTGTQAVNKDYADLKVALAEFTGTNQNLSGSGYQKLPGGLIIQWGSVPALGADGTVYISFPVSFPNNTLGIYSNSIASVTSGLYGASLRIKNDYSCSGFTALQDTTSDLGSFYISVGY